MDFGNSLIEAGTSSVLNELLAPLRDDNGMAMPSWQSHGHGMAMASQSHGNGMAMAGQCHGKRMPISWQQHGYYHVIARLLPRYKITLPTARADEEAQMGAETKGQREFERGCQSCSAEDT